MTNLDKLSEYLNQANKPIITLTFSEIEIIIGAPLPTEAKRTAKWWWNIKDSKKAKAWIDCGYYTYDCANIPVRGNVCFKKSEKPQEVGCLKKVWYFLTDKDAESHKKTMAFLEISVLPLVAVITLLVTILSPSSTSVQNINNFYDHVKSDSQVKIVSIEILKDLAYIGPSEDYPISIGTYIDVKLRNTGDTVAFLKEIQFEIEEVIPLEDPRIIMYEQVPVSETYDFIMNSDPLQTLAISQSIPANGVDRFRIKILSSSGIHDMDVIYVFKLTFIYDEDNKSVVSARHIAVVPSYFNFLGAYVAGFDYEIWLSNYKAINRIASLEKANDDVIMSSGFLSMLNKYDEESKLSREELIEDSSNIIYINSLGSLDEEEWENVQKQSDENYNELYINK